MALNGVDMKIQFRMELERPTGFGCRNFQAWGEIDNKGVLTRSNINWASYLGVEGLIHRVYVSCEFKEDVKEEWIT